MKKLLSLILICSLTAGVSAQDKKFQIGLVMGTTINWVVDNSKEFEKRTNGIDFIVGVGGNFMFNENIGLASGVQFDLGSFSLNYGDYVTDEVPSGQIFYGYSDNKAWSYWRCT